MNWLKGALALLCLLAIGAYGAEDEDLLPPPARLPAIGPRYAPDRVIVAFKDQVGIQRRQATVANLGLKPIAVKSSRYFAQLQIAPRGQGADTVEKAVAALRADPTVQYAEPAYYRYVNAVPNDTSFKRQWGLNNTGQEYQTGVTGTADADIDGTEAFDATVGTQQVIVAVIDTGLYYDHPDIKANTLRDVNGKIIGHDWVPVFDDDDPTDEDADSHGTHVSGIIGAVGNNAKGVSGVCQQVRIMPLRVIGGGNSGDIANAFDYAIAGGAKIINCSFGGPDYSQAEADACQRAKNAGVLVVCAAGNESADNDVTPAYPANYRSQGVLTVAASDANDLEAGFSNIGKKKVDLFAPGVAIYSTKFWNGYGYLQGTSMAAPMVSGAAALLWSRFPDLTLAQVRSRLLFWADRKPQFDGRCITGARLNIGAAVRGDSYEDDDVWQRASTIYNRSPQTHTIHYVGDWDWAKFTLPYDANVNIFTSNTPENPALASQTTLYLFDSNPDSGYLALSDPLKHARISRTGDNRLRAGTYYVLATDHLNDGIIRDYQLNVEMDFFEPDAFEPDNTRESIVGKAKAKIAASATQRRSIHMIGDEDWAWFELTQAADVTISTTGPSPVGLGMELYSETGALEGTHGETNPRIVREKSSRLTAGKYYIHLFDWGSDQSIDVYDLSLSVRNAFIDRYENDDSWQSVKGVNAKKIIAGEQQGRSIHLPGNQDWTWFELTKPSNVVISTSGPAGSGQKTVLYLFEDNPDDGYVGFSDPSGWARIEKTGDQLLRPGVYYIRVTEQFDDELLDPYGLKLEVTTVDPPAAPTNLQAKAIDGRRIRLKWKVNSTNETGFRLWRDDGSNIQTFTLAPGAAEYVDTGLEPVHSYEYKIQAIGQGGLASAFSNILNISTPQDYPAVPENLTAAFVKGFVELHWDDIAINETAYEISYKVNPTGGWSVLGTVPADAVGARATIAGGHEYAFRVRALGANDLNSDFSNEALVSVPAPDLVGSWVELTLKKKGKKYTMTAAIKVKNQGNQASSACNAGFFSSKDTKWDKQDPGIPVKVGDRYVPLQVPIKALKPREEVTLGPLEISISGSTYKRLLKKKYLIGEVDWNRKVNEGDEENNFFASQQLR